MDSDPVRASYCISSTNQKNYSDSKVCDAFLLQRQRTRNFWKRKTMNVGPPTSLVITVYPAHHLRHHSASPSPSSAPHLDKATKQQRLRRRQIPSTAVARSHHGDSHRTTTHILHQHIVLFPRLAVRCPSAAVAELLGQSAHTAAARRLQL